MSTPTFDDLTMAQGSTWATSFNWYGGGKFLAPIEEIDPGYPTRIKVSSHLLPSITGTPVIISGVEGMEILNSKNTAIELVDRVDDDWFLIGISTVAKSWVVNTGEITYYRPTVITDFTARCQFRKYWHSKTVLAELTTENGGIVLTEEDAGIQLQCTAEQTAAFNFDRCVFDVEMISPGLAVTRVAQGTIYLDRERTR